LYVYIIVIFPDVLVKYFQYVASLRHDVDPDYEHCQTLLEKGLKDMNCSLGGKLDFSGKASLTRSSPKKAKNIIPSSDNEARTSATEPHNKKRGTASRIQKVHQAKQQRDHFSASSSSDESDYGKDDGDKRAKLSNTKKKKTINSVSSWKDCPTAIASNVNRAGEYKRINYKNHSVKKLEKKTDA
jgi:hypothetical protein